MVALTWRAKLIVVLLAGSVAAGVVFWRMQGEGSSKHVEVAPSPPPTFEELKALYHFDSESVVQVGYLGEGGEPSLRYDPTISAKYAQALYSLFYKRGWRNGDAKKDFFAQVNWLVRTQDKKSGVWFNRFPFADLESPWISAGAQGEAIRALVRAYRVSHNIKYLKAAKLATKPFFVGVAKGGVVSSVGNLPCYESYAGSSYYLHSLNGFIYSLFGLRDLYRLTSNPRVLERFKTGVETLKKRLTLWETRSGSCYSLGEKCGWKRHARRVKLLVRLYRATGDKFFQEKAFSWDLKSPPQERLLD